MMPRELWAGLGLPDEAMKAAWCMFHEPTPLANDPDADLMLRLYRAIAAYVIKERELKQIGPSG